MTPKRVPVWIYLCIFLTAVLSLSSMYYRHKVEDRNRAVALAADIDTVQMLSASQGMSLQSGLQELEKQGLTAVVLPEEYVNELFTRGDLQLVDGKYVEGTPDVIRRVERGVASRFPDFVNTGNFVAAANGLTAVSFPDLNLVRSVSVGLNPEDARTAQDLGLEIIARCTNPASANSGTVEQTIKWARSLGAQVFLPEGTQVLGRRDSLDAFDSALRDCGMYYASPEFAKIGGDEQVVEKVPDLVIRLHAAQIEELDKMQLPDAIDRYAKAARERNQRILLVRPLSSSADKPLSDFGDFINKIKTETEIEGGIIGEPHPFTDPELFIVKIPGAGPTPLIFLLIALSLIPIVAWTAAAFVSARWFYTLAAICALALAVLCVKPVGRTLDALLAALTLPTAAFVILDRRNIKFWGWEYLVITLISLTGGLAVAGLLNGLVYYIHAKEFLGVKFAHFIPIALVGGYFFYRFGVARKSLTSPVEWGKAVLALIVLGALAFMIARTGNDNPAAVSDIELKLRNLLDAILFVRPRTKEFLIGHPFMILGIGMLISLRKSEARFQGSKGWITLFLTLGAIGQTSIVNTMCHIHTPLTISLARIGVGFLAGGILGLVVWGLLGLWSRRFRPAEG